MGKSTISMVIINSYVNLPEGKVFVHAQLFLPVPVASMVNIGSNSGFRNSQVLTHPRWDCLRLWNPYFSVKMYTKGIQHDSTILGHGFVKKLGNTIYIYILFWPHFPGKTLTPPIFRLRKLGESGRVSHRRRFPELGLPAQRPTASGLGPLRIHAGGPLRMTRSTKHGLSIISGSSLIINHNLSESQ